MPRNPRPNGTQENPRDNALRENSLHDATGGNFCFLPFYCISLSLFYLAFILTCCIRGRGSVCALALQLAEAVA